jgi:hypothetical protein
VIQFDTLEDGERAAIKEFSDSLKVLRVKMRAISKTIREKGEQRPVRCEIRFHTPRVGTKQKIRLDKNEVVLEEAMSAEEKQENLFGEKQEWEKLFRAGDNEAGEEPTAPA